MRSLSVLVVLLFALPGSAQDFLAQGRDALTRATYTYDADSLLAARGLLQLAAAQGGEEADWATYYAALADYRLANVFWASDSERAAEHARLGAEALVDLRSEAVGDDLLAEASALHSGLLGTRMGLDPSLGMTVGPQSQQVMAEAARLAPNNPRVQYFEAAALLNTPPEWGGDPDRAMELLISAVTTFEQSDEPTSAHRPTWGRADATAWLGMAHLMAGDADAARPVIEQAEQLAPHSDFVRYKLKGWLAQLEGESSAQ